MRSSTYHFIDEVAPPPIYQSHYPDRYTHHGSPTIYEAYEASDPKSLPMTPTIVPTTPSPFINPSSHRHSFIKPIAIPQTTPSTLISGPTSFLRAYPPILTHYSITPSQFLAFLDSLNVAQAPSPPVQAVQLVGTGIGFVPHHWAQLASMGIGATAGVGGAAVSATRVKLFLKEANEGFFAEKGLRVRIVGDEELCGSVLGRSGSGTILGDVDVQRGVVTVVERRFAVLSGSVAELVIKGLPAMAAPGNVVDKLSGKQLQAKSKKEREKREKEAWKRSERMRDEGAKRGKGKKESKKQREREEKDVKSVGRLKWLVVEQL